MRKYIGKRLLQLVPILIGITLLTFILMNMSSTDAVDVIEQNTSGAWTNEQKDAMRQELGLDKSVGERYVQWLIDVLHGDMGQSYISKTSVTDIFITKLPKTVYLAVFAMLLTILISIPLGVAAAVYQNKIMDYLIRFLSFIGNSLPNFFVALLLIYVFCVKLGWLSVMGSEKGMTGVILPAVTLAIAMSAKYIRQVRAAVLEELNKDYVLGARARGIKESRILCFHVLRTAMLTIVTLLALSFGSLLGGTAIVESVFMWDGVGKMAVDAILTRDYPILQAYVIWMAFIYVAVNLVADIICHYVDPRIRMGGDE